jgi:hypothetical protein
MNTNEVSIHVIMILRQPSTPDRDLDLTSGFTSTISAQNVLRRIYSSRKKSSDVAFRSLSVGGNYYVSTYLLSIDGDNAI